MFTKYIFAVALLFATIVCPAQLKLYDQNTVNTIRLTIPTDSFAKLYALDGKYYAADFTYSDGIIMDTFMQAAIRFRGNTSLVSNKKSIKVSFNTYDSSGRYKGVRKLNLIGNHNDPTMIREKLFNYCWNKFGMVKRRISFVNVYVNNTYFGLYTNIEEVDKEWLKDVFSDNEGNLYKCSWGADLTYNGTSQSAYKNAGCYDLQTNETANNFSDLVKLITAINGSGSSYLLKLDSIFDYKNYLKALALNVATGNWDDYAYNKSNYCLYHDSASKQIKFITIDCDNTFGVDWSGIDWTTRDPYKWYNQLEARPLVKNILNTTSGKALFTKYLDSAFTYIVNADSLFPLIDSYQAMITPSALLDSFRVLDYGYSMADFNNGFIAKVDNHTPYGVKPFIQKRKNAYVTLGVDAFLPKQISMYPNPCIDKVHITKPENFGNKYAVQIINVQGQIVYSKTNCNGNLQIDMHALPNGLYVVNMMDAQGKMAIGNVEKK
jgi:CotH kinase protein/Secretion system C-terminal sorting domain